MLEEIIKIVLYGDSITDMDRIREPNSGVRSYGFGYPFFIAGELFAENPNRYDIINNGISGNRVVDLYARIKRDVWNCEPDVLSILIGINDVWHDLKPNGLANGVDIETYEKFYRMIIEDTVKRFPDIKIILLEPFYLKGSATAERYDFFQRVKEYAKIVKKLAGDYGLAFVELQNKFDLAAEKFGAEKYLYDGIHPDVAGAKLIADEWLKTFRNVINK